MTMEREQEFLNILREVLEQYTQVFQVLREIDHSIGDGNRELRDKLSSIENTLRSQIEHFTRLSASVAGEDSQENEVLEIVRDLKDSLFKYAVIISVISTLIGGVGFTILSWLHSIGCFPFK